MTGNQRHSDNKGKSSTEREKPAELKAEDVSGDSCRCKEVSKKTIPEMLKLMLSDLAFWKKAKRQESSLSSLSRTGSIRTLFSASEEKPDK